MEHLDFSDKHIQNFLIKINDILKNLKLFSLSQSTDEDYSYLMIRQYLQFIDKNTNDKRVNLYKQVNFGDYDVIENLEYKIVVPDFVHVKKRQIEFLAKNNFLTIKILCFVECAEYVYKYYNNRHKQIKDKQFIILLDAHVQSEINELMEKLDKFKKEIKTKSDYFKEIYNQKHKMFLLTEEIKEKSQEINFDEDLIKETDKHFQYTLEKYPFLKEMQDKYKQIINKYRQKIEYKDNEPKIYFCDIDQKDKFLKYLDENFIVFEIKKYFDDDEEEKSSKNEWIINSMKEIRNVLRFVFIGMISVRILKMFL